MISAVTKKQNKSNQSKLDYWTRSLLFMYLSLRVDKISFEEIILLKNFFFPIPGHLFLKENFLSFFSLSFFLSFFLSLSLFLSLFI